MGEQAAVPAERSEGNGRPDSSFVEEGGGQQRHPNVRAYLGRRQRCVGQHFWARGDCVSTVGRDAASIREGHPESTGRKTAPRAPDHVPRGAATSGGGRSVNRVERFTLFEPLALPGVAD